MTQTRQPEALRLAEKLRDMCSQFDTPSHERGVVNGAIQELRSQHARIKKLEAQLSAIGAGGVEQLRKQVVSAATPAPDERAAFEAWLRVKPCGAAHDFGWAAWKARASLAATHPTQQGMDAQDAARYRYLRETDRYFSDDKDGAIYVRQVGITSGVITGSTILTDEELDAAIDTAIAAQAKQGGV